MTSSTPPYDEDTIVGSHHHDPSTLSQALLLPRPRHKEYVQTGSQAIDEVLCAELGIDARVISLMKRLPYFRDVDLAMGFRLFPPDAGRPRFIQPRQI